MKRIRGLFRLVEDVVEHGTRAVERVHKGTSARPFALLEQIPGVAEPAMVVHVVHDTIATGVYSSVRAVNWLAFRVVGGALTFAELASSSDSEQET